MTVTGTDGDAVHLIGNGTVTNNSAAQISASRRGVAIFGTGTVVNLGTITGNSNGVYLRSGTLTNSGTAARISSSIAGGIYIRGTVSAVVVNQGTISGRAYGVDTGKAGTVTNSGTAASIIGGFDGVDLAGTIASSLTNEGTIVGTTSAGVHMTSGGVLRNTGTAATITGGKYGVRMFGTHSSTVINSGTIGGGTAAVQFQNVNGNYLKLYPGAVENGAVNFGTGTGNVLALGSGTGTGTISASSFTGFATLDVAFGGTWALQGTLPLSAEPSRIGTINNSGTIVGGSASGLDIRSGGVVNNSNSISGGTAGVFLAGAQIGLHNNGFINGATYGVEFRAPGTFASHVGTLVNSAFITGGQTGVYLYGGPSHLGVLRNAGSIIGSAANGVYDVAGGAVYNLNYSFISGATNGILAAGSPATVTNYATITGVAHDGVYFEAGGALLNRFGTITGGRRGVNLAGGPGEVTNGGTIVGLGSVGNSIGVGVSPAGRHAEQQQGQRAHHRCLRCRAVRHFQQSDHTRRSDQPGHHQRHDIHRCCVWRLWHTDEQRFGSGHQWRLRGRQDRCLYLR